MSESSVSCRAPNEQRKDAVVEPLAPTSGDGEATYRSEFEDDEPEPLSFAPHRLRLAIEEARSLPGEASDQPTSSPSPQSRGPESVPRLFEALSMRVSGSGPGAAPTEEVQNTIREIILDTSERLQARAERAPSPVESARLSAFAERLKEILYLPAAQQYLSQPGIADELLVSLQRYAEELGASGSDEERQDVLLKATVTAINSALCLAYWRSNPRVPRRVQELLTGQSVYGSVLEIAKVRKPAAFDRLIADYASAVNEMKAHAPARKAAIKPRNPVLWSWARFNFESVSYYRSFVDSARWALIWDAKLMLVLFNVLLDDVSDSLQDAELLDVLAGVPAASGELGEAATGNVDLKSRLREAGREHDIPYLEIVIRCWRSAMSWLREATGPVFDEMKGVLGRDYDRILKTLRFSCALNERPLEVLHLPPSRMSLEYGERSVEDIMSHNANRMAFFTIDAMAFRAAQPAHYEDLAQAGATVMHRRSAMLFQLMHQIGNSVATGAREVRSDDISNGMFKVANDLLNSRADWPAPAYLAGVLGEERADMLIRAFDRKREVRRHIDELPPASEARAAAQQEYEELAADIEQLIELSGAETAYFSQWIEHRDRVPALLERGIPEADREGLLRGNDLLLVLHLIYKGKI